ncbi:MAG: shikimate dehydrogenase [Pseudomonadota bacterium]
MTNDKRKAAVIGWPVKHSRSPLIHGHWLKTHEIAGTYEAIAVAPDDIQSFFEDFPKSGLVGANVTIPHKETVIPFLSSLDKAALEIGAVNTVWLEDKDLHGTNTDWTGFLDNLDQEARGWDSKRNTALVVGAGGAARGIVYGLNQRGFDRIVVANRTLERAEVLAKGFGHAIEPIGLAQAQAVVGEADVVVNTTSLGMEGSDLMPIDLAAAQNECVVTDIVYVPLETPFLRDAKRYALKTVDGLGMLLHQAAPGCEKWFGVRPIVTAELRAEIVADLNKTDEQI